jgi:hypothetical protein
LTIAIAELIPSDALCEIHHKLRGYQVLHPPARTEGFDMRVSFCRFRTSDPAGGDRWSYCVAVLAVVGWFAVSAAVISERSHRNAVAAPAADLAGAYSGGGNLVPVF